MLAFAVLGSLTGTEAQDLPASQICAKEQVYRKQLLKQTLADPAEDHYDVRQVTLDISLDNNSVALKGEVLTTAVVVSATMPAYVFELNNLLAVDSVKLNGQVLPCTTNGDVRTVNLPAPLPQNATFTARVYYQGSIVSGGQFFGTGIRNQSSPSWGNDVTFTMSEPYASKDWWPVKQSLRDKIDSADIRITVPATLKAGSNGVLQNITPLPGNKHRYEWKTRYPIDYYLISLAAKDNR